MRIWWVLAPTLLLLFVLSGCKPDPRAQCNDLYARDVRMEKQIGFDVKEDRKPRFIEACVKLPADVLQCATSDHMSDQCMHIVATNLDLFELQEMLHEPMFHE